MKIPAIPTAAMVLLLAGRAAAVIIHVPGQYPTIQAGIDAAQPSDIVLVAPGRYVEEIELKAGVIVRGAGEGRSIIDGNGDPGDVVRAIGNAINEDAKLQGFTVTGASNSGGMPGGGGVFCNSGASPDVSNCRIEYNDTGIACWNGSKPHVHNCIIIHNVYTGVSTGAAARVVNNTIHDTRIGFSDYSGYGPVFMNNIVTGCSLYGVYGPSGGTPPQLTWNDVWGNGTNYRQATPGTGSISVNPLYADTVAADFHLQSGSPCIDTGNPAPEYNDPDGTRNDMGAYGGPGAASNLPQVVTLVPGQNALNVDAETDISAGFNLDMDPSTITGATFLARGLCSGTHYGTVSYDSLARMANLDPDAGFLVGEPVVGTLTRGITTLAGDSLAGFSWGFLVAADGGSGHLMPPVNYAVGHHPVWIVVGLYNSDEYLDLAVANANDAVSVLLGNGDGTFQAAATYPAGQVPHAVRAADFDADSILDLVVPCVGHDSVAVLLGNGDGTFGPPTRFAVGTDPFSIDADDFDLDGDLDLVTSDWGADSLTVLLGNGDGSFSRAGSYAVGNRPFGVESADFDNDGYADLAAVNSFSHSVSVLLGNGDGSFGPKTDFPVGTTPQSLCLGDWNGDGFADIATANLQIDNVSVLLNDGAAGFADRADFAAGDEPLYVATADLDGDARLDLLVTLGGTGELAVLSGLGDGRFGAAVAWPAGTEPVAAGTGDFDLDGDLDAVSVNHEADSISVLLNEDALEVVGTEPGQYALAVQETTAVQAQFNLAVEPGTLDSASFLVYGNQTGMHSGAIGYDSAGFLASLDPDEAFACGEMVAALLTTGVQAQSGVELRGFGWNFNARVRSGSSAEFGAQTAYPAGTEPRGVCCADFDADGDCDIAVTCSDYPNPGQIAMLRNNGDGTFSAPVHTTVNQDPISVFGADLDADSDIDLAVFHNQPGVSHLVILKNDGTGGFTNVADYAPAILGQDMSGADFDADGDIDLVLSDGWGSQDNVRVMWNSGTGGFSGPANYSAGSAARGCGCCDADNDGDADILVANSGNSNVSVLLNDGAGSFDRMANYSLGQAPNQLYANDLNADGWVDLAFANYSAASVTVILNHGDGTFGAPAGFGTEVNTKDVLGADFDGDSDIDLAASSSSADTVAVLLNDGAGAFGSLGLYPVGPNPWGLGSADFNLDGAMDLACASFDANNVSVLLATGLGIAGRGPQVVRMLEVRPNPFRGRLSVRYQLGSDPGQARVGIYDAAGRLVRQFELNPGVGLLVWNGRDTQDRSVAPGVYFVRLDCGVAGTEQKVVLTR